MIFKSKAERTLDKASAMLDTTTRWVKAKQENGGLSEDDKLQFDKEMHESMTLAELSRQQSHESLPGDIESALRRLFREGRLFPTEEEIDRNALRLKMQVDALRERLR